MAMKYKLPVIVTPLSGGGFLARCKQVRATATGNTSEEAIENLREAVEEMVQEYGEEAVLREINPKSEVQVIEVAL